MDWQSKPEVQKGNIGERIVKNWLRKNGYGIYAPETIQGAHIFDMICARVGDKSEIFIAEVKTKPARKYYPDTGIDERSYNQYVYISKRHSMEVVLFFVDEERKQIYKQNLSALMQPYKLIHNGRGIQYPLHFKDIVYFPLAIMDVVATLNDQESSQIKQYRRTSY